MSEVSRTIGRRQPPEAGQLRPPSTEERAWVASMGKRRTRVPKGVFRYRTQAEANSDWEQWQAESMARSGAP